ncbi:MAG: ABC transporter substrate-binding protein [Lachnospiraceae bacterium]|nr:ABC transporter substrate-binding protein [Lachnospiraceae bacterium]
MKRRRALLLIMLLGTFMLGGCGKAEETKTLSLAYQYGLAYAPAVIAEHEGYIEEAYRKATGNEVTVTWNQMSSGADINTGIAAGELDGGFMGVAPAITGVTKGVGYRIFSNLSGQRHGMMTNDAGVNSLKDLAGTDKQIALVNIGSIQHIILGKALVENGLDAHALDANIVAMKHPDGMSSLESGIVSCHLTSSPYIFKEEENGELHELTEVSAAWTVDDSFIVGVASEKLHDTDPELYKALCEGIQRGIDLINSDPAKAAAITAEPDGNTVEEEIALYGKGSYHSYTSNLYELAVFMGENGFVDNAPASYRDIVFDNVEGN